jgi:hypothetical protein
LNSLSDDELIVRVAALAWDWNWPGQALAAIGTASVPVLLEAVRNPDRYAGSVDTHALPYRLLRGESEAYLREWCRETLVRIGRQAIPTLQAARHDANKQVNEVVAKAPAEIQRTTVALPR